MISWRCEVCRSARALTPSPTGPGARGEKRGKAQRRLVQWCDRRQRLSVGQKAKPFSRSALKAAPSAAWPATRRSPHLQDDKRSKWTRRTQISRRASLFVLASDRSRDFAPVLRDHLTAGFFRGPASYSISFTAKIGDERFPPKQSLGAGLALKRFTR
jgi:hypothetical protein